MSLDYRAISPAYAPDVWRSRLNDRPMTYASVCVLSYERLTFLQDTIETMHAAGFPFELIVRDDGSGNPSIRRWLMRELEGGRISQVVFAPPGHNEGVGASVNRMFAMATGDPIIKADQDVLYESNWLENVVRTLDENARDESGPLIGTMGLFRYWHDPVDHEKMLRADHGLWQEVEDYVSSCLVVRRAIWEAYGPWEEHSEAFAEDIGFKRKLSEDGFVHALPKVDLARNIGFGVGPSTVVVDHGKVRPIHSGPWIFGGGA